MEWSDGTLCGRTFRLRQEFWRQPPDLPCCLTHLSILTVMWPLLFVLAILFISRFTEGYIYGIVAAIAAVIEVNYIFTYPYFEFNFTITGYPADFCDDAGSVFERQCPDHSDQAAGTDPVGSGKREDAGKSHAGGFP